MKDKITFTRKEFENYLFEFVEYREGLESLNNENKELIKQYIKHKIIKRIK